jgi:DNA-binding XRE family transcriptional regulator
MRGPDPPVSFAGLLRRLRTAAGLTQEELAEAASVTARSVSNLERGSVATPQKETVRLLADALQLIGPVRAEFETAARSHRVPAVSRPWPGSAPNGPACSPAWTTPVVPVSTPASSL